MKELYDYCKKKITSHSLRELTLSIIEAHKGHRESLLRSYGRAIFPSGKEEGKALFYKLIKYFHPDRLVGIQKELDEAFSSGDREKLLFYKNLITVDKKVITERHNRFEMDFREMYDYDREDFGYGYYEPDGQEAAEEEREFDFLSAVMAELMGNQDLTLTPGNLASLEGELNLADYGIEDTEGLQYCRNLSSLNLSGNNISNLFDISGLEFLIELYLDRNQVHDITPLTGLTNLEVLDLSENEIEDLSPLLTLDNLKFLNISSNPLYKGDTVLGVLEEKGVIIIR